MRWSLLVRKYGSAREIMKAINEGKINARFLGTRGEAAFVQKIVSLAEFELKAYASVGGYIDIPKFVYWYDSLLQLTTEAVNAESAVDKSSRAKRIDNLLNDHRYKLDGLGSKPRKNIRKIQKQILGRELK